MNDQLTISESERLTELEKIIKRGLSQFITVGESLLEIRDARLYRLTHKTFEDYCREKWQFTKTQANRLIAASGTTNNLTPVGVKPKSERQVRPLTKLEPEHQAVAWERAVNKADGEQPTAKQVENAVEEVIAEQPKTRRNHKLTRTQTRVSMVERRGIPEVGEALKSNLITAFVAERIASAPNEDQAEMLKMEMAKPQRIKMTAIEKDQHLSDALMDLFFKPDFDSSKIPHGRGVLSDQLKAVGFATYTNNASDDPYVLPPMISQLEHSDRLPVEISGLETHKTRLAYKEWLDYHRLNIRDRVLRILFELTMIEIVERRQGQVHFKGFTNTRNMKNAEDFGRLVDMLCADLQRLVTAKKQIARYGKKIEKL